MSGLQFTMQETSEEVPVVQKVKKVRSKEMVALLRIKRRILKHVWAVRIFGIVASLLLLVIILYGVVAVFKPIGISRYLSLFKTFVFTPMDRVKSIDGRTNILILGKGGKDHEAPELTDTMMFASISHSGAGITLVSLPRDIWIPQLKAKLNSTYYWGNKKTEGGGFVLAKATVEEIIGQPIQYVAVIDFSGITNVVDTLGGVEVEVDRAFTDERYPIAGREADKCGGDITLACRYETVKFEKGLQHMDGATTLKFIRSRYAEGDEGTDFARSARQQKVIAAIEKKITTRDVLFSPTKVRGLVDLFEKSVETDIDESAGAILARRLFDGRATRQSHVLGEDFLVNPPIQAKYDNLYVFVPKEGNWDKVHEWIKNLLSGGSRN